MVDIVIEDKYLPEYLTRFPEKIGSVRTMSASRLEGVFANEGTLDLGRLLRSRFSDPRSLEIADDLEKILRRKEFSAKLAGSSAAATLGWTIPRVQKVLGTPVIPFLDSRLESAAKNITGNRPVKRSAAIDLDIMVDNFDSISDCSVLTQSPSPDNFPRKISAASHLPNGLKVDVIDAMDEKTIHARPGTSMDLLSLPISTDLKIDSKGMQSQVKLSLIGEGKLLESAESPRSTRVAERFVLQSLYQKRGSGIEIELNPIGEEFLVQSLSHMITIQTPDNTTPEFERFLDTMVSYELLHLKVKGIVHKSFRNAGIPYIQFH